MDAPRGDPPIPPVRRLVLPPSPPESPPESPPRTTPSVTVLPAGNPVAPGLPAALASQPLALREMLDSNKILGQLVAGESLPEAKDPAYDRVKETVERGNAAKFKEFIRELPRLEAARIVEALLIEFAYKEKNDHYHIIINNIHEIYPQLSKYTERVVDLQETRLTAAGMRVLIDHLAHKEKNPLRCPCMVCENFEIMKGQVADLCERHPTITMAIIVRNQEQGHEPGHMTPLLMVKKGETVKIVITDSIGSGNDYTLKVSQCLKEVLAMKKESGKIKEFFIYGYHGQKRQQERVGCSVFSIRDIVQMSRYPDFIDYVERQAQKEMDSQTGGKAFISFSILPPTMMKITQSLEFLKQYDERPRLAGAPVQQNVQEAIKNHLHTIVHKGQKKLVNNLPKEKYLKYERLLIAKVIRLELS